MKTFRTSLGRDESDLSLKRRSRKFVHSRKIQGEYMGLIRHLAPRDRERIKKLAADRGREVAIKEMRAISSR